MYNTYVSSTIYSIRNNGPLSHSFNDYPIFINERCSSNPLPFPSSSPCCSCCLSYAFPTHRVPKGPSILYGSRQSVLLQWSASRRLILGGGNRLCYRFPEYGRDQDYCEVHCCIKDVRFCHRSEGSRCRRCCMISESRIEFPQSNGYDEEEIAEAMISLIGEEYFGSQEKIRSSKRLEVGSRGSLGGKERSFSSSKRLEVEKRGKSVKEKNLCSSEKISVDRKRESDSQWGGYERKTNKFNSINSKQNNKGGSITIKWKDEHRQNEGLFVHSRDDNQSLRKEGSSCSSYYSVSSPGDIENDAEVEDKNVQFVEESQSRYRIESGSVVEGLDGHVMEDFKRRGNNEKDSMLGNTAVEIGADWQWRKNTERTLSEVSTKVTSSVRETSKMNSRSSTTMERDCETSSSSKKFVDKEEKLKMAVTLNGQSEEYGDVSGKQGYGVFINEGKKYTEVSEISCSNSEMVSCSPKWLIGKNENLELDANLIEGAGNQKQETASSVLKAKSSRLSSVSQQLVGVSENRRTERERISHQTRQSDAVINTSESKDVLATSTKEIEERCHQTRKHVIEEADSRQKFLHLGVISVIKDGNTNTSSSSETRTQHEDQNVTLVSTSNHVTSDLKSQTDQKASQKILSRKGSRDAANTSVVRGTDKLSATHSQKTFEKRSYKEETNKSLVDKTFKETRKIHTQNNSQVVRIELGKEAENHAEKLKAHGSSNLISQTSCQGIGINEEETRSSQATLMPPPSQLVARNSLHVDLISKTASQIVSSRTSGSSSSALYMHSRESPTLYHKSHGADEITGEPAYLSPTGDALGSVDRLERSSTQFVREFIEKSRNELSVSEIQNVENKTEVEKYGQESMSNYGFLDNQMKDPDSRDSSRSSGTKGPSDEMWHVTDLYIEQPPKAQDPEIDANIENAIVKRSGRSLWNIISDIVHLRWSLRAETSDSALKSGGRVSSNESVSNETWFSGREHEETDKTKMGKNMASDFTSSDQPEQSNSSAQTLDLLGDKKSENTYNEVDTSSSPSVMESKASGGNLSASGEVDLKDCRNTIEVVSSGLDIEQSSLPLPPQGIRRSPTIQEISHNGRSDALANSSMVQLELPHGATLPEISTTATKDGELKQRKLQRNKQVPRDRFDEWEEAYILETEQRKIDEMFMREALAEAKKAGDTWEVPVGAVVVKDGKIIARGYNLVEELRDSTAHAEMICIREASKLLRTWRLAETTLYVTLEPCPMCAGAILQARIDNLVWGAPNKLLGADGSWIRLFPDGGEGHVSELPNKPAAPVHPFHPKMAIRRGVLASECADMMQQFFQLRRKKKVKKEDTPPLTVAHHPSKLPNKLHNVFHMLFCL